MLKRYCDFCGTEISVHIPDIDRDSKTQFYKLFYCGEPFEKESDICNDCLKKIIESKKGGY